MQTIGQVPYCRDSFKEAVPEELDEAEANIDVASIVVFAPGTNGNY
jgi:hypothetical protein